MEDPYSPPPPEKKFAPSADGATMLIGNSASETLLDDQLIPGMKEYKDLKTPKVIVAAGSVKLHGTGTGIISCIARDEKNNQQSVHLQATIVSGIGSNAFSPSCQVQNGVKLILEAGNKRLMLGKITLSLNQHPQHQGTCSLNVTLLDPLDTTFDKTAEDNAPGKDAGDKTFGKPLIHFTTTNLGASYPMCLGPHLESPRRRRQRHPTQEMEPASGASAPCSPQRVSTDGQLGRWMLRFPSFNPRSMKLYWL